MMLKMQRPASTTEATTRAHCAHRTTTSGAVPRDHLQLTSTHTHTTRSCTPFCVPRILTAYMHTPWRHRGHTHVRHVLQRTSLPYFNFCFILFYFFFSPFLSFRASYIITFNFSLIFFSFLFVSLSTKECEAMGRRSVICVIRLTRSTEL